MRFCKSLVLIAVFGYLASVPGGVLRAESDVAQSAEEICPLLPGAKLPAVTLQRIDGSDLDLAEAVGRKPSILIFYRGGW